MRIALPENVCMTFSDCVCENMAVCGSLTCLAVLCACVCAGPKGSVAAASEAVKGY